MSRMSDDQHEFVRLRLERERWRVEGAHQKAMRAKREADLANLVLAAAKKQLGAAHLPWHRRLLCWLGYHKWSKLPREVPVMLVCDGCFATAEFKFPQPPPPLKGCGQKG